MAEVLVSLSAAMADLVASAGAGVVTVDGRGRMPASGVLWSADGLVVTSHHVLERDEKITVGLPDGSRSEAELVGRDPATDLALLRLPAAASAPAWVSSEELRVGHLVLALGRPGQTVQATLGIVSALGAAWRTPAGGEIERYVQTDVVMYPGFSGGPLVEVGGRIAGVNTSALLRGTSLTVPTETVERVVAVLLEHGRMPRGYLGVGLQPVRLPADLQSALGQETGLMIMSVEEGGPAAAGGLLQGDILVALGGVGVRHIDGLQALLAGERAGQSVALRIVRGGQLHDLAVVIGERS